MNRPRYKTTVDQHKGTHEPTGLPIYELKDIVTDYTDIFQERWDSLSAEEQDEVESMVAYYHSARVELESLPSEHRERAREALAEMDASDPSDMATVTRRAIAETSNSGD